MRITKITVQGDAGNFAEITAPDDPRRERRVMVEISGPKTEETLSAPARERQALWGLAAKVQARLDGFCGAGGDVRDYFDLIERVAGC